jgi:hypothetical protein
MAIPFQDAVISNLGQKKPTNPTIGRGSLITFNYIFHKNDPIPLVLVTDVWPKYIRGVNLHYLTFPAIKKLLYPGISMCENSSVTYQYIKGNDYVSSAFRQYKRDGMISLKKMDCDLIVKAMSMVRSFDPNEIEAIRKEIREQLSRITNSQAF